MELPRRMKGICDDDLESAMCSRLLFIPSLSLSLSLSLSFVASNRDIVKW